MNPKKTKEKERRRARKLADEAWEAANNGNLDLAEKIIRRAVDTQPENPTLWNDQGMLLGLRGKESEAEEAFRTALSLAPTYAEPCARLAAIQARRGYYQNAIRLMESAVRHAPQTTQYAEQLETYRVLMASSVEVNEQKIASKEVPAPESSIQICGGALHQRLKNLDWRQLGEQLTRDGCVLIPSLLDETSCVELGEMFGNDALFAKTVVMDRDDFGRGVYCYFAAPIPGIVDRLRRSVYPYLARIANEWRRLLNESERYPDQWETFRELCKDAGQTTPTPILLKYGPGGFNALHRDLRGTVFFPIQMAVVLSPRGDDAEDGFRGGEFMLCDVPERKKSRRGLIAAGLGDAVLFCTRDRLVQIGGAYGLQPVKHGVAPITEGTRLVLGVPFHEYR